MFIKFFTQWRWGRCCCLWWGKVRSFGLRHRLFRVGPPDRTHLPQPGQEADQTLPEPLPPNHSNIPLHTQHGQLTPHWSRGVRILSHKLQVWPKVERNIIPTQTKTNQSDKSYIAAPISLSENISVHWRYASSWRLLLWGYSYAFGSGFRWAPSYWRSLSSV